MSTSSNFGALIRTARQAQQMSQETLAAQLGVRQAAVSAWELGKNLPASLELLFQLCDILRISPAELRDACREAPAEASV